MRNLPVIFGRLDDDPPICRYAPLAGTRFCSSTFRQGADTYRRMRKWLPCLIFILIVSFVQIASADAPFDVIIKGGAVYDGTGGEGRVTDIAIRGDRIAGIGDLAKATATTRIDARGLAVAPGFINMLSWSTESLIQDGRSQSEIRQGVTT